MAGFMSSNVSMTICQADKTGSVSTEGLRRGAFTDSIDPDGFRFGWTGLGDLLDVDNFALALFDARFSAFSYRLDAKRPSPAVTRLQLAERIRDEEARGNKVGRARKRELREAIVASLISQAEFAPELIDCLWDSLQGRLFVASTSEKKVERVLTHFKGSFGIEANPIAPEKDMAEVFAAIQGAGGVELDGYFLEALGTASLCSAPNSDEKRAISVRNSADAVNKALSDGMIIRRMAFAVMKDGIEEHFSFTLSDDLLVNNLAFGKNSEEKDQDATFLLHCQICAQAADIAQALSTDTSRME